MPNTRLRFKIEIVLLTVVFAALLSGCATGQDTQRQSTSQTTTLSGYVDTGAQNNFK
jgi:hypothetical protein